MARKLYPEVARQQILKAANQHRLVDKPFTMRHIQWAVCVVRRNYLVSDGVLIDAGFNPARRPSTATARKAA